MADNTLSPEPSKPFVLEVLELPESLPGRFTPHASIRIGPAFASSGISRDLDGESLSVLLLVFSTVTANGGFVAAPESLAPAMGVSPRTALDRLRRCAAQEWHGAPLLTELKAGSGLSLFHPARTLYEVERVVPPEPGPVPLTAEDAARRRAHIVQRNRDAYTRPRAEVEASIYAFYGRDLPPTTPEEAERQRVVRRLESRGLTADHARQLTRFYTAAEIDQQIEWLPYRNARNPAAYLVSAIEGGYGPPPGLVAAWEEDVPGWPGREPEPEIEPELLPDSESTALDSSDSLVAPEPPGAGNAGDLPEGGERKLEMPEGDA